MQNLIDLLKADRAEESFGDKKPLYTPAEAHAEAERCLYCTDAPCIKACPTAIDIPNFIKKIASGNVKGSAKKILEQNLLGYSCSRVCPVEELCVGDCVYNGWEREPIQIGRLQRYATETALNADAKAHFTPKQIANPKKVACIGAGPGSLAFAGVLALEGHKATIFEKRSVPGGLNTTGIAPYKLKAKDAVREAEWIVDMGVELKLGSELDGAGVAALLPHYDAIFLGLGLGEDTSLGAAYEAGEGVIGATAWIEQMKLGSITKPKGTVLIVGGGNTAIDVARECAGLGCEDVAMVYRRGVAEMSGYAHELEGARIEGVRFIPHAVITSFVRNEAGALTGAMVADAKDGKAVAGTEKLVPCELCILAIGQSKLRALASALPDVTLDAKGCVVVDGKTRQTGNPKIFAGGDCINGGKEVVNAVADGRDAARALLQSWAQ
jgi:glutamate synthase (NADPH/NADH) small chain